MTKQRAPLTFEDALIEVSSVLGGGRMALGYERMAEIAGGMNPRTVRKWADEDCPDRCSLQLGVLFDLAYQQAGGDGAPIYEAYGAQLEAQRAERFSDAAAIARLTIDVIKEGGEAHAALVVLTQPGATDEDRRHAAIEVQQARAKLDQTLPLLTKGIGPSGFNGEGNALGGRS